MEVYFSTVIRDAPPDQGGELVWMDWKTKRIKGCVPIAARNPDLNDLFPGSSTRGGRGIQVLDNKVIVASYHTLKIFDRELVHQRDISNGLMVGLHETCMDGSDNVWASCTTIDAAIQVSLNNGRMLNQYWPAEMHEFQRQLNIYPMNVDKNADNRMLYLTRDKYKEEKLHLNAVAVWEGSLYALLSKQGVVINIDDREIVFQDRALRGGHNLYIQKDGTAIVNDTYGRTIREYDIKKKSLKRVVRLTLFPQVSELVRKYWLKDLWRRLLNKSKLFSYTPPLPLFLRGMSLASGSLFVGVSPATILCIDWHNGVLVDMFSYSKDLRVCIHGIKAVNS